MKHQYNMLIQQQVYERIPKNSEWNLELFHYMPLHATSYGQINLSIFFHFTASSSDPPPPPLSSYTSNLRSISYESKVTRLSFYFKDKKVPKRDVFIFQHPSNLHVFLILFIYRSNETLINEELFPFLRTIETFFVNKVDRSLMLLVLML